MDNNRLIVKKVPRKYPVEALDQVFMGVGAVGIKHLVGSMKGTIFIDFKDGQDAALACEKLRNIDLNGKKMSVEFVKNPVKPQPPPDQQQHTQFTADPTVVKQITNLLKSSQSFYTNVLNLMKETHDGNKSDQKKRKIDQVGTGDAGESKKLKSEVTQEDEEDEDEEAESTNHIVHFDKSIRVKPPMANGKPIAKALPKQGLEINIQMGSNRIEFNNKLVELGIRLPIGDIPLSQISGNQVPMEELIRINKKPFEVGSASSKLYLKNLEKSVEKQILYSLFRKYFQSDEELVQSIDIQHFKSGPLRNQAFATFKDQQIAVQALSDCQGYLLTPNKPLIIQFSNQHQ